MQQPTCSAKTQFEQHSRLMVRWWKGQVFILLHESTFTIIIPMTSRPWVEYTVHSSMTTNKWQWQYCNQMACINPAAIVINNPQKMWSITLIKCWLVFPQRSLNINLRTNFYYACYLFNKLISLKVFPCTPMPSPQAWTIVIAKLIKAKNCNFYTITFLFWHMHFTFVQNEYTLNPVN